MVTHAPVLAIVIPLLGAFALPLWGKLRRELRDLWAIVVGVFTLVVALVVAVKVLGGGEVWVYTLGAASPAAAVVQGGFPIRIVLEVDALSAFMGVIALLAGIVGLVYTLQFLREEEGKTLAMSLYLLLWAGILGLVYTGDLFNFFVFFEITSIAACGLIGYRTWESRPPEAAFKTMVMYTLGGLLVLLAVGILYGEYDALNIAYISSKVTGGLLDRIALGLLLGGLLMKAGAVPAHMWAPDAYGEAPPSATILLVVNTQAAIYGLSRVVFTLFGGVLATPGVGWLIAAFGVLTIVVAALMALVQKDLGRLIAFGAVSQLGYMLLGLGVGAASLMTGAGFGQVALRGGIFHMINDAATVGLLFLLVGVVQRAAGTKELSRLGGLGHVLKAEGGLFLLGSLALAGIPPLNGFASKILIYESSFHLSPILAVLAILSSILLLAVVLRAFHSVFLGPKPSVLHVERTQWGTVLAMGTLALVIVVFGLFPGFFVKHLVDPAVQALWAGRADYLAAVLGG